MRMTAKVKKHLPLIFEVVARLPKGQHFDIGFPVGCEMSFQAPSQQEVAFIRSLFPGAVWKKTFNQWWNYDATWRGLRIQIYAVREAPPTCHAVEEEVEVEEQVPVAWETRTVKQMVTRWECGEEVSDGNV